MKIRFPFNNISGNTFFQQLFFYCLLVGLIPCILTLSDLLAPNLPSITDFIPVKAIKDGLTNTGGNVKQIGENIDSLQFNEKTKSLKDGLMGIRNKATLDSLVSKTFQDGIKMGVQTFVGGAQLGKTQRIGLLALYLIGLIVSTVWCFWTKNKRRAYRLAPGFIFVFIAYLLVSESPIGNSIFIIPFIILYPIFAIPSIYYFIKNGHIRSNSFLWALITTGLIFGVPHAFLFALIAIFLRVIYMSIQQNYEVIKPLKKRRLAFIFIKSLIFWTPLLLFVIPGNKASNSIYESTVSGIYTHIFNRDDGERGLDKKLFVQDLNEYVDSTFAPIEGKLLDEKFAAIEIEVKNATSEFSKNANAQSSQLPKAISKIYYREFSDLLKELSPYFKEEKCGWHIILPTSCCMMNGAKSYLYSKLKALGNELGKTIEKDLAEALKKGSKDASGKIKSNEQIILESLDKNKKAFEEKVAAIKSTLKSGIMGIYNGINFFNLIMDILLFFLIVKSFMVVFSRVAFSGQDEIYITLLDADKEMANGKIKKYGNQFTISSHETNNFYASRSYEPSGRPPKFSIPQKVSVIFGRLRTGNYALNHIVMKDREGSVYYNALGGTQFVQWALQPGEEVVFNLRNFVAMSETVKLTTTYSFRMTSLLLGRLSFTTARGPGKLVLLTKGEPVTSGELKGNASVPVSRIIAFQKNTRFHVHSELNMVDVFLSGIYLQKKPEDLIIIDADEKGSAKSGISKFIRSFLLPI